MRREPLVALLTAAMLVAGCATIDDRAGVKRSKEAPPAPLSDDGQIVAAYLALLDRLGGAGPAGQVPPARHRIRPRLRIVSLGHGGRCNVP